MRKALGTTVQAEVAEQLNKLINGQYRWASNDPCVYTSRMNLVAACVGLMLSIDALLVVSYLW
jgi:hypothetical protein